MGVKRSGRQGQSLRSLRPHIGMCSLNARGEGSTLSPAEGMGKKLCVDRAMERWSWKEPFRMPALWKVRHQTCRCLSISVPGRSAGRSEWVSSPAGEDESTARSVSS